MRMILIQDTQLKHLWSKIHWPDLHLHSLEGVVGPVPAVPSDPVLCYVLTVAVENSIQV